MISDFDIKRSKMVKEQLEIRGIKSASVLDAMRNVPRHLFVPKDMQSSAYDDAPLPIGFGQTISQPFIVAFMTEQLSPSAGMKVLEIGTGSGYQTAILAHLGCDVFSIELLEAHVLQAKKIFSSLNLKNINAKHGNGFSGWEEEAPFDAIMVTAAPPYIPEKLIEQLKDSGTMIVPVGKDASSQYLKLITKKENKIIERNLFAVRFVPMVEQSASN